MKDIKINTEYIKLDQLLKFAGVISSGTEAKELILNEKVSVNGITENRRGRKLYPGDKIEVLSQEFIVR
jgi:ribosome-associated protein